MLFAGACGVLSLVSVTAATPGRPPNILLIVADDLGYGELGSYGQQRIATPELDRLASEGMRFTQFYAGSAVCAPSRSVLMTGKHVGHTTVRGNSPVPNFPGQQLQSSDVTTAALLKRAGYRTGLIGKWGLGDGASSGAPWKQGFDEFFGFLSQTHAHNHFPDHLWRNDQKVRLGNDLVPMGKVAGVGYATQPREYANDLFFAEAERFIERSKEAPFFLYLALTLPHANNERAEALGDGQEVPDYGPYAKETWPDSLKGQAAMITRMDSGIGKLLQRLRELGLERDTVVMFTSDNGPHNEGGKDYDPEFFDANGPWSGLKRNLTEGGIRVPYIVRWPAIVAGGAVSASVGHFADLLPTCAELAGVESLRDSDGVSLVPAYRGAPEAAQAREHLYWELYEPAFQQAVLLEGRWKALRGQPGKAAVELYDLANDPGETHDVSEANPALVERCLRLMDESHVPNEWWQAPRNRKVPAGS
ncbi:MAG TPA: arylsulfatase [Opitutus sp.]|nr:arylsulfatase [Opitutus sp.]